jgi:PEP-CTERM motif
MISHAYLRAAVAGAAAALLMAAPARADIVFDFSGTCFFTCTGTATGVLTLEDSYVFEDVLTNADFISFTYSSSSRSYELTSAASIVNAGTTGGISAVGSLVGKEMIIEGSAGAVPFFDWTTIDFFSGGVGPALEDAIESFKFTRLTGAAAPEPSTWAMMLLGLAGLGYAGYRKARPAAVASV